MPQLLLLVNLCATLFMTGVIWYVQVVHYPLFARVGDAAFVRYESEHASLTTLVVILPMLIELGSALGLWLLRPPSVAAWKVVTGLVMLGVIWLSTMAIQVPKHGELAAGFNAGVHASLVATNWVRTILWTLRSALVVSMLYDVMQPEA
jgi:hypothetical protein